MRNNSQKQSEASRRNGSKSNGPKSPDGKSKAALNATRDGVFSRQVVIEQLGEKQADFENLKQRLRADFQPSNLFEEMLVEDFVENWWRRERIRQAEAAQLRTRVELLSSQNRLEREKTIRKLDHRFTVLIQQYALGFVSANNLIELTAELEDVRQELMSIAGGPDFLLYQLHCIQTRLEKEIPAPIDVEVLFHACCGFGSDASIKFAAVNRPKKPESGKSDTKAEQQLSEIVAESAELLRASAESLVLDPRVSEMLLVEKLNSDSREKMQDSRRVSKDPKNADSAQVSPTEKETSDDAERRRKNLQSEALKLVVLLPVAELVHRKLMLEDMEKTEKESAQSMAVIHPEISDRFSRAETAVERRMYRAVALLAMRAGEPSTLLLKPKNSK